MWITFAPENRDGVNENNTFEVDMNGMGSNEMLERRNNGR